MKKIEKLLMMNREELLYFLQNIGCPPEKDLHDGICEEVQSCLECWKNWGDTSSTASGPPSPQGEGYVEESDG